MARPSPESLVPPPPVGDELASLLILCCNEVGYTRQCLENVFRYTRPPFELVLVDNGSTDGTAAYLEEACSRPGPVRVEVIRNETNLGFPAGCNQALARAHGRFLVFLNNDTVVTDGWLDSLIRWARHDWPTVGLVGPVTNFSRPPQEVPVDYPALDGLEAFAARRRRQYAGQALDVERLTGFCLLARREVIEQVGGFDERYGQGFFEDDDLCVRARQAGFRLLAALDVFVHHFGSRTFAALGVDCPRQLRQNFALFQEKWGPAYSAGYRPRTSAALPAPVPAAVLRPAARRRLSVCIIARDEEANLPGCLASVADLADDVVVADTGSTDGTREAAAGGGARVVNFAWVEDFAAARNEALRHATGDWVFWLDADERLDVNGDAVCKSPKDRNMSRNPSVLAWEQRGQRGTSPPLARWKEPKAVRGYARFSPQSLWAEEFA